MDLVVQEDLGDLVLVEVLNSLFYFVDYLNDCRMGRSWLGRSRMGRSRLVGAWVGLGLWTWLVWTRILRRTSTSVLRSLVVLRLLLCGSSTHAGNCYSG